MPETCFCLVLCCFTPFQDRTDESSADVVPDASEEVSALVANIQNAAIFGTSVEQCTVKRGYSRHPRKKLNFEGRTIVHFY